MINFVFFDHIGDERTQILATILFIAGFGIIGFLFILSLKEDLRRANKEKGHKEDIKASYYDYTIDNIDNSE
jgi:hypothetical protein